MKDYFTKLFIEDDSVTVNDIEGKKDGKLISLTTDQLLNMEIADGAETIEAYDSLGYENAILIESSVNWSEKL